MTIDSTVNSYGQLCASSCFNDIQIRYATKLLERRIAIIHVFRTDSIRPTQLLVSFLRLLCLNDQPVQVVLLHYFVSG